MSEQSAPWLEAKSIFFTLKNITINGYDFKKLKGF